MKYYAIHKDLGFGFICGNKTTRNRVNVTRLEHSKYLKKYSPNIYPWAHLAHGARLKLFKNGQVSSNKLIPITEEEAGYVYFGEKIIRSKLKRTTDDLQILHKYKQILEQKGLNRGIIEKYYSRG